VRTIGFTLVVWLGMSLVVACTREPVSSRDKAMRPLWAETPIADDLPLEPLIDGIRTHALLLKRQSGTLTFGEKKIPASKYAQALERLLAEYLAEPTRENFFKIIKRDFEFYEVYGGNEWGEIMLTSYFEPVIPGSRKRSARFSEPLLRTPHDLIEVSASEFDSKISSIDVVRGRLAPPRMPGGLTRVVPYYSRGEIKRGALDKQKLELCWVDPIDAFVMQIQGSGTVTLEGGKSITLGYAERNGQRYEAVGKFLKHAIPLEEMTLQKIEGYLRTRTPVEIQGYLDKNPSYVFFREMSGPPTTTVGTPVIAGRTIATDARLFPKGTLAFLIFEKPEFADAKAETPLAWKRSARFVLDQDTGGAIRGTARADLFWGSGAEAKRTAGLIQHPAALMYLVPRDR